MSATTDPRAVVQAAEARRAEVLALLERLRVSVETYGCVEPTWGHVGDLGHAADVLGHLAPHFGVVGAEVPRG